MYNLYKSLFRIVKKIGLMITVVLLQIACNTTNKEDKALAKNQNTTKEIEQKEVKPTIEYGFLIDDYEIVRDTIRSGDTFGEILNRHGVSHATVLEIANNHKDKFDVRKIREGRPYAILRTKEEEATTRAFIYEKDKVEFTVIDFQEELKVHNKKKPVTIKEHEASGVITSSLAKTMQDQNLSPLMTDRLSNIYAWTVNFFKLQKGDKFKVVYTQKYINDTIPVGLGEIKAAIFEHGGKPLYSFNFASEESKDIYDFFDEEANNLRRAFLKAPVQYSRISSRYNLNRRIAYYGNKVRPHLGTDFAAPIGTPILATADGVVSESAMRGGNGNYVKIRHNSTYETQYLHMKSRNVKVGEYVRQGDVIGWVGMTGNTSGPHVCYRFWKNGKQVDPFMQDLPASEPLEEKYHEEYFAFIQPLKEKLDNIQYN